MTEIYSGICFTVYQSIYVYKRDKDIPVTKGLHIFREERTWQISIISIQA